MTASSFQKKSVNIDRTQRVTDDDLATFLDQFADSLANERLGRSPLADALHGLAKRLRSGAVKSLTHNAPPTKNIEQKFDYAAMTLPEIINLLEVEHLSKRDLISLARIRFSMPSGNLKKLRLDEIKNAIMSASNRELSLNTIADEALRQASKRKS